jgi:hypothetical protein
MKIFKMLMFFICASSPCLAESRTDEELVKIAHQSHRIWMAETTAVRRTAAFRSSLQHLSDAERTRALILLTYDFATKKLGGRIMYNAPSMIDQMIGNDPTLISDPAELKRMIAAETDSKKFYILVSMAGQLIESHKADFVLEMTPMLFRNEPAADMGGEYYFESLSNVSFLAYGMITKNLKALNADFTPPDEKLPYKERIPVLVKWLKANWPGCENLGENTGRTQELRGAKPAKNAAEQNQRSASQPETVSSGSFGAKNAWWKIPAVAGLLFLICGLWFMVTSRQKSN